MSGFIVPEPGWIAAKMMPFGSRMAMAMLGVVCTDMDGKASDDDLATFYATLADTDDSVYAVNEHYREVEARYPFLSGVLGPLTGWTEEPSFDDYKKVRDAASILAGIAWSEVEAGNYASVLGRHYQSRSGAGGDILGRVYNQMISIGARRTTVFNYSSIEECYIGMIERGAFLTPLNSFIDAWCGSGCRVIAAYQLAQDLEWKTDIPWRLNDPNPVAAAIAGLNMIAYGIGPDVKIASNREWAEMWAHGSLWAMSPEMRANMPPELSLDTPIPASRLGQETLPRGESPFHRFE